VDQLRPIRFRSRTRRESYLERLRTENELRLSVFVVSDGADGSLVFTSRSYILGFALPNFFFHVTAAYDLLRHWGMPIGIRVFLGRR
jgi:hypothetical protein